MPNNNSPRTPRNRPIRPPPPPRIRQNLTGPAAMTPEGPLELVYNFVSPTPTPKGRRKEGEPKTFNSTKKKRKNNHPNKNPTKKPRRGPNSPNASPRRALNFSSQLVL